MRQRRRFFSNWSRTVAGLPRAFWIPTQAFAGARGTPSRVCLGAPRGAFGQNGGRFSRLNIAVDCHKGGILRPISRLQEGGEGAPDASGDSSASERRRIHIGGDSGSEMAHYEAPEPGPRRFGPSAPATFLPQHFFV